MGSTMMKTAVAIRRGATPADSHSLRAHEGLRRRLQREKAMLLSGDDRLVTPAPDPMEGSDTLDRASVDSDYELLVQIKARKWEALRRIDGALRRIDTHVYGTCEDCGDRISAKRLSARPDATRCVSCQTRHEGQANRPARTARR